MEYLCGISGQAGNLQGKMQPGGNPFEGPRNKPYPNPPLTRPASCTLSDQAMKTAGYHPFPMPAAQCSQDFTNNEGVQMFQCVYCGFCGSYGCEVFAKASPNACVLPKLLQNPNFELRTESHVVKVNVDSSGKRATGVTYIDGAGNEVTQPAKMVVLASYMLYNVRLLLVSNIGKPYDPTTGQGVVGARYTFNPASGGAVLFNDKYFNQFIGTGALLQAMDDFNADNFDHSSLDFIDGPFIAFGQFGNGPATSQPVPPGTPSWGTEWKKAVATYYARSFSLTIQHGELATPNNYVDLDPTYKDVYGQPLLRITYDYTPNVQAQSKYVVQNVIPKIVQQMNPTASAYGGLTPYAQDVSVENTHNMGGASMGTDPNTSATNKYGQVWDVPNVFVCGGALHPQNPSYNPTISIGALTFWQADGITKSFNFDNPASLA